MCLSGLIDKSKLSILERHNLRNGVGYKVFLFYKDRIYSEHMGQYYSTPYPVNKWIKNTYKQTLYIDSIYIETYVSGFHIFLSRKDAKKWMVDDDYTFHIRKIKFKNVTSIGFQEYCEDKLHIAVAQEMLICPRPIKGSKHETK